MALERLLAQPTIGNDTLLGLANVEDSLFIPDLDSGSFAALTSDYINAISEHMGSHHYKVGNSLLFKQ